MNEYLRPSTLFSPSKFPGYLNANTGSLEKDSQATRIKKEFERIKGFDLQNPGVEDWPHKINQIIISNNRFKSEHENGVLSCEELEFLETRLTDIKESQTHE